MKPKGHIEVENGAQIRERDSGDTQYVPILSGSGTVGTPTPSGASGTITTSTATGRWQRNGSVVHIALIVTISAVGSASGDLSITLPASVPASMDLSMDQGIGASLENITYGSSVLQITGRILNNSRTIKLYGQKSDAASAIVAAENGTAYINGSYFCA